MQNWPFLFKVLCYLACKSSCLVLVLVHICWGRDGGSWCLKYLSLFNSCLSSKFLTVLSLTADCLYLAQVSSAARRVPPSAAPAPPEGWVQWRGASEVLSELHVLQLCLLQGWTELCALSWPLWHRLSAQPPPNTGQPLQVPAWNHSWLLGRDIKPFWELHGCEARHRMGTALGFLPCPSLWSLLLQQGNRGATCHSADVFLLLELSSHASLLDRIPWQQQHLLFLGRVAKFEE